MNRREVPEDGAAAGGLGVHAIDRIDPEHAPELLPVPRDADGTGDAVADPQPEAADLAGTDVDVLRAGQQAVAAHEPEALVDDVENPGSVGVAGSFGLPLKDAIDEIVLAVRRGWLELELT